MKHVLLLDDDPTQLAIRKMLLSRAGIESQLSIDPRAALALLRSEPGKAIGAVITDHVMPAMAGIEFVREVRAFDRNLPVIVVSGMPDAESEYAGLGVLFLPKPCDPEDMISIIRNCLAEGPERAA